MKAVIFDMDGTLLDSEGYWGIVFLELLKAHGVPYDEDDMPWKTNSFKGTVRNYLSSPGCKLSLSFEECVDWGVDYMYRYVYSAGVPQLKPNAIDTLEALQALYIPMCLLTTTRSDSMNAALDHTGLRRYFRFCESTFGRAVGKEMPQAFEQTAMKLGCSPAECIVVEDSLYAIKTAKEAGCTVWAIEDLKHVRDQETIMATADRYFRNHAVMGEAFRQVFG